MDDGVHGEEEEGGCMSGGDAKQEQKMRRIKVMKIQHGCSSQNESARRRKDGRE
jgi:hypothetical protein